jgi:homoserine O-acetyltransferase
MRKKALSSILFAALASSAALAAEYPEPVAGDFRIRGFSFASGEMLPELSIHYRTIGKPHRDAAGAVDNAILILHGTTGSGRGFLSPNFAGMLFGPGQILDASRYYLILPDGIGHGESSRPSDSRAGGAALHARFPRYGYDDMVAAQHALLVDGLRVKHLRLVLGTSMGGMHCWVWGEKYPGFMDGLVPLAAVPTEIAGRNRILRRMISDSIRTDPDWKNGEYTTTPRGLEAGVRLLLLMISAPMAWHAAAPTRDAADRYYADLMQARSKGVDANDFLYAFEASRDYDPSGQLGKIEAPVLAINFADDFVNPPELGLMEKLMPLVPHGKYVLVPASAETKGHTTHSWPKFWGQHLDAFLANLPVRPTE